MLAGLLHARAWLCSGRMRRRRMHAAAVSDLRTSMQRSNTNPRAQRAPRSPQALRALLLRRVLPAGGVCAGGQGAVGPAAARLEGEEAQGAACHGVLLPACKLTRLQSESEHIDPENLQLHLPVGLPRVLRPGLPRDRCLGHVHRAQEPGGGGMGGCRQRAGEERLQTCFPCLQFAVCSPASLCNSTAGTLLAMCS